jgi:hypothetical protein
MHVRINQTLRTLFITKDMEARKKYINDRRGAIEVKAVHII